LTESTKQRVDNGYESVKSVARVDKLEIDSLPKGAFSRLFIELIENGIGRPIQVPVVVAKGKKDGPIFGITAALHGNELNGIPVIHQLLQKVNLNTLRGTLVCVIVANMPGMLGEYREFNDGVDLNHIMPGKQHGNRSQVYAFELVERITNHFDYLVDLHTASSGRVNSLYVRADLHLEATSQMAYLLRPQIIVHNPPSDYTLRGVSDEAGKPAITVEICDPQRFQRDPIKRCLQGIRRVLGHVGMIPGKPIPLPETPVLCARSYWIYTDRGGLLTVIPGLTDLVKKGDLVASQINIFGDVIREYHAPEDGVVIGHSVNPVSQSGARILHLGVLMNEEDHQQLVRISDGVVD
jgi:predicted deacylase